MICTTVDQAFTAGWDDAAGDRPLNPAEIGRLVALHRPYLAATAVATEETPRPSCVI